MPPGSGKTKIKPKLLSWPVCEPTKSRWGRRHGLWASRDNRDAVSGVRRRLRRSAACAAGGGDADGEAEPDEDDDAESDDIRMRLAKLEAMEHGELDWDDDDVYGLGRGQSWSSVDHLA